MGELAVTPIRHGPFPGRLAPDAIAAYAAATGDQTPAVRDGLAVPVGFPVILVFEAQEAARADLPAAAWERARGGVHGGLLGVDDPGRVARVAVRFSSSTQLDSELTVNAFGIENNSFAFEAVANGTTTISHGRLELRR